MYLKTKTCWSCVICDRTSCIIRELSLAAWKIYDCSGFDIPDSGHTTHKTKGKLYARRSECLLRNYHQIIIYSRHRKFNSTVLSYITCSRRVLMRRISKCLTKTQLYLFHVTNRVLLYVKLVILHRVAYKRFIFENEGVGLKHKQQKLHIFTNKLVIDIKIRMCHHSFRNFSLYKYLSILILNTLRGAFANINGSNNEVW